MKRAVIRLFGRILSVVGLGASYDTMATLVFDGHLSRRAYAETCTNSNGEVLSYTVQSTTQYYKAWQDGELSGPFLEVSETASSSGTWSYQAELSGDDFYVPAGSYVILSNACNPGVATGYGELWDGSALYSASASEFESMGCEYVGSSDVGAGTGGGTGGSGTISTPDCYYTEAFVVPTVCYTFDSCAAGATQVDYFVDTSITECVTPLIGMREHSSARACYMYGPGLCERSAPVNETCTGGDYYDVLPFFGATTGAGCYYKSNDSNATGFHIYPVCEYEGGGGSSDGDCYDVVTGIIACRPMDDSYLNSFFGGALPAGATIATCWSSGGYGSGYCPNGTGTGASEGCWYFGDSNCYGESCAGTSYGFCSGVIEKLVLQSLDEAALSSGTGYDTPFYYKSLELSSATGTGCNQIVYFADSDAAGAYEYLGMCYGTGDIDTYGGSGTGVGYTTMGTVRICPDGTSYVVSLEE